MQAATSTMRAGLYAQQIVGIGLDSTERQTVLAGIAQADALAQAIREAITRGRNAGLDAFAPDSATLTATLQATGLSSAQLRTLFAEVIGHPYSAAYESADQLLYPGLPDHGALTLAQWSQAAGALALHAARKGSTLPPGEGGGLRHAQGHWFVNGEPYTLAELFLTVRMGTLEQTDKALETDLDTMRVNTNLARELLAVLADMKRRRDLLVASKAADEPTFRPGDDFAEFVKNAGLTVDKINDYGFKFKGASSYLDKYQYISANSCLFRQGNRPVDGSTGALVTTVTLAEYGYTMDELQALFDSVNAENQVKRLKVQSVQNARTAVLEGMSAFLSSTSDQNSKVGRNL
jgi:hypothetical protein